MDIQLAAAESIQRKLSAGMDFLRAKQVNNLILREGYAIEGETVLGGDVAIAECHTASGDGHGLDNVELLTRDELKALAYLISNDWIAQIHQGGIDGIFLGHDGSRYRANVYLFGGKPSDINDGISGRIGCMIRVIPNTIPKLQSLGLPPYMRVLGDANYGLLLCVGPTGAGKSTTLAAFIDHINNTRVGHIVMLADPIELVHQEEKCRISAREVGTNVSSFEMGVRDALRELPIAIGVGEIRNEETLVNTMRAAHSGHFVAATRHAPNAISAIRALVDDMPGDRHANAMTVSETLLGVVFQVCVPGLDDAWHFVHEVLNVTNNPEAKALIANQQWTDLRECLRPSAKASQARMGCTLNENLAQLVQAGKVSAAAADRRAYDRPAQASAVANK
jgi:twitching motility protein PilT